MKVDAPGTGRAPLVVAAERMRIAGRLLEEVSRAMDDGEITVADGLPIGEPIDEETAGATRDAADLVNGIWGALAGLAGPEYLASLQSPTDQSFRALHLLGEITVAAASIEGGELVKAMEDGGFMHREVASLVMRIRVAGGVATTAEMVLLTKLCKGEA